MKKSVARMVCVLYCATTVPLFSSPQERSGMDMMPVPQKVEFSEGIFRLDQTFLIAVQGEGGNRLYLGATRMLRRLAGRTGLFFYQHAITSETKDAPARMFIQCRRPGRAALFEDESYSLVIGPKRITLQAETDIGILRGLETFLQLLQADDKGYTLPTVTIRDEPRFPWRGLLIDVCRHFIPVETVKRNLDGMAAVKMNVLHWHLSEDQGFRVECLTCPKLHQLGSDGLYYTQEQIRDVIAYADDLGIRVVPEFDIPGHTTSWFVGYPELASMEGSYSVARKWGVHDAAMDPTREQVYTFLEAFFKEMCTLFPDDYMHIGGDEVNGKQWDSSVSIQKYMRKHAIPDNHGLQRYFNTRILGILTKCGKKMVGWDEIFQPDLPRSIVIQSWRGRTAMEESAKRGYQTILSNGYYIDLIQPAEFHYRNDPVPEDSPLSAEEKKYILGGEATMWSEFVNDETIDSRIWPRTAAIAERFWSAGSVRDVRDMYRRLETVSFRLEELGLTHEKNVDMMLRRLTNNTDIYHLKILVDLIEPVKGYRRGAQREYTSASPFTRIVDAARPDAGTAREFRWEVDTYLTETPKDSMRIRHLRDWLSLWKNNHALLLPTLRSNPILHEIEPLSEDLSILAAIGLEAMDAIQNNRKAGSEFLKRTRRVLNRARDPRGQTELQIIDAVEALVKAAAGL
jgi:hexosaminidase